MSLRYAPRSSGSNGAQGMGNNMRKGRRAYGRLVVGLVALAVGVAGCSDGDQDTASASVSTLPTASASASPTASASASPTVTASPSPSATPSKKPAARATVDSYGGWNLAKAVADARAHHVASVTYSDASELHRSVVHTSNWKVCTQSPSAGTYSTSTKVAFKIVGVGESCSNPPSVSSSSSSSGGTSAGGGSSSSGGSSGSGGGTSKSSGSGSGSGGSTATGGGSANAATCSIRSNAGNCYRAGQFCRNADVGATTTDEAGRAITCGLSSGRNRWHY